MEEKEARRVPAVVSFLGTEEQKMRLYPFSITILELIDDLDAINTLYGRVDDVSVMGHDGKTIFDFDREADSLETALRSAIVDLQAEGWHVDAIRIAPESVLPV